jgi:hypothetical protein
MSGLVSGTARPAEPALPAGPGPGLREQLGRLPLVIEALGYLGTVLGVVAGFIAVRQIWPSIPATAEVAAAAFLTVMLLVTGILLRAPGQPAFGRLRSVLWLISAGSLAATFGLLVSSHFWDLGPTWGPLLTEAVVTAYAAILWWRSRAALQHLATFAATAALLETAIGRPWPGAIPAGFGGAWWVLSLIWGITVWRGHLIPLAAGYVAAGIGLLVGAQLMMGHAAGQVLGVATVAGLLAAGVALRRVLVVGFGALGAAVILPQVANRYLPSRAGAAAAVLAVGVIVLGVAIWLARTRHQPSAGSGPHEPTGH